MSSAASTGITGRNSQPEPEHFVNVYATGTLTNPSVFVKEIARSGEMEVTLRRAFGIRERSLSSVFCHS
jgi:hypothetical protein